MEQKVLKRLTDLVGETRHRKMEALRCYRPIGKQLLFHTSRAKERIVRGGKRSGKTVAASAELASAVTGVPIIGPDGKPLPRKYPKANMLVWVIGWDLAHIGQTLHRVLFQSDYFRVLPGEDGNWFALNRANSAHMARFDESQPAGPMIPERMIKSGSWGWENRAENIFKSVVVNSPWGETKICAFPSTAIQAKQGDAVDLIWIDEDLRFSHHVSEYQDRLADKSGHLIWSAWPHGTNDALVTMSERANQQADADDPRVSEVVLRFSDNPFIPSTDKEDAIGRMDSEEDRRSRDYGEFLLDTVAMYNYIPSKHGIFKIIPEDPFTEQYRGDVLSDIYTTHGQFPDEWTRYLAIDPSHTRTAALIGVVPPPKVNGKDMGGVLIIENEVILKKAGADELAIALKPYMTRRFEAFVMDFNMGRQTRVGAGRGSTIMGLYQDAFQRCGHKSRITSHGFIPGNNVIQSRTNEVRTMMSPDQNGRIRLRLVVDSTYATQREFGTYRKKTVLDQILDEPANSRTHDAMNALEYLVSYVFTCPEAYVDPSRYRSKSPVYRKAQQLKEKWKQKQGGDFCHIGPGALHS